MATRRLRRHPGLGAVPWMSFLHPKSQPAAAVARAPDPEALEALEALEAAQATLAVQVWVVVVTEGPQGTVPVAAAAEVTAAVVVVALLISSMSAQAGEREARLSIQSDPLVLLRPPPR